MPRKLSQAFMDCLHGGFLAALRDAVAHDVDLNLEIRANYLNIYYKGNSLLKLTEISRARYNVTIHQKFSAGLGLPTDLVDEATTQAFVDAIPRLKHAIALYGKRSLELEYEQLIIRANNAEPRNNSEYFIIDRQYSQKAGRFDLIGLHWPRAGRHRHQEVPLCLFEVKFALNQEIAGLHRQLQGYYSTIEPKAAALAEEMQDVLLQKLDLGLFRLPPNRVEAMKTLRLSRDISQSQFVILLVDYNPNSKQKDLAALKALPFAHQIRLMETGFAM